MSPDDSSAVVGTDALSSSDPAHIRAWLAKSSPKQLSLLDKFEIELRLGRLSTRSTAVARDSSTALSVDPNSEPQGHSFSGGGGRDRRLVTVRTVELLRSLVGNTRWSTGAQLMALLRGLGKELNAAGGFREPAIGNIVRRIMCAVRDEVMSGDGNVTVEYAEASSGDQGAEGGMGAIDELSDSFAQSVSLSSKVAGRSSTISAPQSNLSLASMLWAHPQHLMTKQMRHGSNKALGGETGSRRTLRSDSFASVGSEGGAEGATADGDPLQYPPIFYAKKPDLRQAVMEAIQEIMSDLEDLHKNINDQATSHIHAGEVILTYGRSRTVELFLKAAAAKKRKFQVIVCEGAPHFGGHVLAKSLASFGIHTTVINDSATFAIMARVNKVLLPAHAVLANGGLIAPSGSNMVALAAKQNSVPVVSITGMFKLCPMYPHEGQDTLNDLVSPSSVVDYSEMSDSVMSQVEFINPVHDYIAPQLISLYVTNIGGFQPSYIYRLLAEYYHSDDWESFE